MIKKLTAHGNSAASIIDKPILELLNIGFDAPLEIATDGKSLIVSPSIGKGRGAKFSKALANVNARHGRVLKKLAE